MFAIYYPGELKVSVGEILPYGQIKVEILQVKGPFYWTVNGKPRYKLKVKKV
jgi:hypothetical protein